MTVFEQACLLLNQRWAECMPDEFGDIAFSKAHQKKMERLFDKMRGDGYHRFTRRATVALIAAVIVVVMTASVMAIPAAREFIIEKFFGHAHYSVNADKHYNVEELHVGYIPEGFKKSYEACSDLAFSVEFSSDNDSGAKSRIIVSKMTNKDPIDFDTETHSYRQVEHNGVVYVVTEPEAGTAGMRGLMWNDGRYLLHVSGNISLEELLKIADSVY